MSRYYTRVCNFYYGAQSRKLVKEKKTLPLNGSDKISFDQVEIISRKTQKKINIKKIDQLDPPIKKKVNFDIRLITKKKGTFKSLNLNSSPKLMGILNMTPDSFSDGGKYNKYDLAKKQSQFMR